MAAYLYLSHSHVVVGSLPSKSVYNSTPLQLPISRPKKKKKVANSKKHCLLGIMQLLLRQSALALAYS